VKRWKKRFALAALVCASVLIGGMGQAQPYPTKSVNGRFARGIHRVSET
jgi:hypothetical protein